MAEGRVLLSRTIRQLGAGARLDLVMILRNPSNVVVWLVTDFLSYTSAITAVLLVAERFRGIAGWPTAQLVFLVGFATTASALRQVFFGYNVAAISRRIGRGQLDHVLLQPRPLLICFLTEGFAPFGSLGALLPGLALLVGGWHASHLGAGPQKVIETVVCLVASMVIVLAGTFAIGATAFWAPRGAEEISTRAGNLLELSNFPLDPLPRGLRTTLLTVIPAGFVSWFPASVLLGRRPDWEWVLTPLAAVAALVVASFIFLKGLRHYGRTGSSRYSDFGHRR